MPYETLNASATSGAAALPTELTGVSGVAADSAKAIAIGTFFSNSCWISFSSSGKLKTLRQSSGRHSSFLFTALAVSQVDISGVIARVPCALCMWSVVSPLVT